MKLAPLAAVLLIACGGAAKPAPAHATEPDRTVLLGLRMDAARYLGCQAAAIALERVAWSGDHGTYRASGCAFEVTYVVACDAPDRCGFAPQE